jgi:hypothetical protein
MAARNINKNSFETPAFRPNLRGMTRGIRLAVAAAVLAAASSRGKDAGHILNVARTRLRASRGGREATEPKGTSQ